MTRPARLLFAFTLLLAGPALLSAQETFPLPAILKALKPRLIGPANMSGRVVDVAVYDKEPRIMYVASASGGLWKTTNHGHTWKPVFERESSVALGAVAVSQSNADVVWVGTGEANPRNSVSWGDGVYRSTDGGKTWKHMGLKETQHVGRIVIHPTNPDVVYVAALGKLWGANPERGLFKTSDGGKSWQHVLKLDDDTGCVDVAMDPTRPELVYAAAWQVRRGPFSGGNPVVQTGPKSGLYKTSDGGATWAKLAKGLPDRAIGRCGISIYAKDPKVVFAVVQTDKTNDSVQGQPANGKLSLDAGGIFRSVDHGETWTQLNSLVPRPFYYGQIRVDPSDDKRLYVLGISFHVSRDGGHNFGKQSGAKGTHSDYHALWVDPRDPHHLVLGCDGGLNFSHDRGVTWAHLKNLPVSQFYAIGLDMQRPYKVYGGLQDNGSWGGPSATRDSAGITIADWVNILGFDGYHCQVDPEDANTVYCEGQYGILRRVNIRTGETTDIKPRLSAKAKKAQDAVTANIVPAPAEGTPGFRFNWSSPILLSPHNPKTVYFAGNFLFRSENRGDTWAMISPDLTLGKPGPSAVSGHTITTVAESPLKPGLIYTGSDDGRVCVTHTGGKDWYDLSQLIPALPQERWVSRVECSRFNEGTVYLAVDRHRNDDRAPYVYRSNDYGKTWASLAATLPPGGPVYVIREDLVNRNLLYLGTEFGLFISLDGGKYWHKQDHLPTVPVHDLVIHPRDNELVIATHGRGIYVMDVRPLQELSAKTLAQSAYLAAVRPATAYRPRAMKKLGITMFAGENPPYGAGIYFFLRETPKEAPAVTITDAAGTKVAELTGEKAAGMQHLVWKLMRPNTPVGVYYPVPAGTYTASLRVGELTLQRPIQVAVEE